MERGDIATTLFGEARHNLGAGASVVGVSLKTVLERLEPTLLLMLMKKEGTSTIWNRMLHERLLENKYYHRRLQHA